MFNSIRSFLFDLDTTLVDTRKVFIDKMREVADLIVVGRDEDPEDVLKTMLTASSNAFGQVYVNPKAHWDYVLNEIKEKYVLADSEIESYIQKLFEIYDTVPDVFDGTTELLDHVKEKYPSMGLVTHAERDWTVFKLESTGLARYFDQIHLVDVNTHKGKEHWLEAAKEFGMRTEDSCVVGDSIGSDILPAYDAGFRLQVYFQKDTHWSAHKDLEIPSSAIQVSGPRELYELLIAS